MRRAPVAIAALFVASCTALRPACVDTRPSDVVHGSAACIVVHDGRLLAIRHRFGGKLGLPGGGARDRESARCTAERETWEETGLAVRARERLDPASDHNPVYRCEPLDQEAIPSRTTPPLHALPEVLGVYWLRADELDAGSWRFPAQLDWLPRVVRDLVSAPPVSDP